MELWTMMMNYLTHLNETRCRNRIREWTKSSFSF